jgi:MtaA/CmuA family methyltransferase
MNGYQRIDAVMQGRWPDGVPVLLHNFMLAAREAGYTMSQYRADPRCIADSFIRAIETYQYDGVLVDVDTATLAQAVGVPVDLPEDDPARCHSGCLPTLEAVDDLPPPDVGAHPRVQIWLEATRILADHFRGEIFIRGNCDQAPFSLASMMRTPAQWMMDLLDPDHGEHVLRLLDWCTEASSQFVRLMAASGAHMVSNGDSPAGPEIISPDFYRRFAQPYEQRLVALAHQLGLPYVLHICGRTDPILDDMLATGADGLEIDYKTDVYEAHRRMRDRAVFLGNLDPSGVLTYGTPGEVERKTHELLDVFSDTPRFILNAGCAIPPTAPSENLHAMIRAARSRAASILSNPLGRESL